MFLKTLQYGSIIAGGLFLGFGLLCGFIWMTHQFARWLFPGDMWDPWGILTMIGVLVIIPIGFGFGYIWAKETRNSWDRPKTKPTTDSSGDRGV